MKLGMIARADCSGLGVQSAEFHSHMHPDKTLLIDLSQFANDAEDCNKNLVFHYPPEGVRVWPGWNPDHAAFEWLCQDIDVIYTAETTYGWGLYDIARRHGVKLFLHTNPEFSDHVKNPRLPWPHRFLLPTVWKADLIPEPKVLLPVPVAAEKFTITPKRYPAKNFLHVIGRPAMEDRNGTNAVLEALQYVDSEINVTITCAQSSYAQLRMCSRRIAERKNLGFQIIETRFGTYFDLYRDQDVLLMPRRWGGMSLPIQEALGHEMGVVVGEHDVYALDHYVARVASKQVGQFEARVPVETYDVDPVALARKIDELATVPQYLHLLAEAWTAKHSWAALKPEYDRVLGG